MSTLRHRLFAHFPFLDGHTISNRYKIRPVCNFPSWRAGWNHETGTTQSLWSRQAQLIPHSKAKRFARAMHASLIFCSTSASINVQKIFKIVLAKAFDLKCVIPEIEGVGEPILIYVDVWRCRWGIFTSLWKRVMSYWRSYLIPMDIGRKIEVRQQSSISRFLSCFTTSHSSPALPRDKSNSHVTTRLVPGR